MEASSMANRSRARAQHLEWAALHPPPPPPPAGPNPPLFVQSPTADALMGRPPAWAAGKGGAAAVATEQAIRVGGVRPVWGRERREPEGLRLWAWGPTLRGQRL